MDNTPTKEPDDEKWPALDDILKDIPLVETSILIQKITELNIQNEDEINILVDKILSTAYSNENLDKNLAILIKEFRDSLSFENQEFLKNILYRKIRQNIEVRPEKGNEFIELITQMFNFDLVHAELIVHMLEVKFPDKNFEKKIHQLILDKVEAKVTNIVNTVENWQIPQDILQLQRLLAVNKLQNRELTLSEKSTFIEEILSQINLTSSDMIEQISPLKLKTSIEIDMFVKTVIESVAKTSNSSKYAEVIHEFEPSLNDADKNILKQSFNFYLMQNYRRNGNLKVFTPDDVTKAKRLIDFITALFNMNLIQSEFILSLLSINFVDKQSKINFRNNILEQIGSKVKMENLKNERNEISSALNEINKILISAGMLNELNLKIAENGEKEMSKSEKIETIQSNGIVKEENSESKHMKESTENQSTSFTPDEYNTDEDTNDNINEINTQQSEVSLNETKISNQKDEIQVVEKINSQTQSSPVIDKPQTENSIQTATISTASTSSTANQPENLQNNIQAENKSILVKDFEDHLKNLINNDEIKFDITKFNSSSSNERSECVKKLIKFAIENSAHADKLASFTNELVMFGYKKNKNKDIQEIPKFLNEYCDKKLKIFNNKDKSWIEIEGFGVFLAHMYVLEVQKLYLMNFWLDETKKLAYESDFALKMLLKVLKIIHQKMKAKDPNSYQIYRKEFKDFKNKFPQGIPKMYENWIDEIFGVSKSQNNQPQPSTSNLNQDTRSPSVASSTSNLSTNSKAQIIPKSSPRESESLNDDSANKLTKTQHKKIVKKHLLHVTQSSLVIEFDEYLQTIKNGNKNFFDVSKFNASSETDRRQCVQKLIEFGIKNTEFADKVAKFTQSFVTFNIKSSRNKIIKDVAIFLTEICDEKLKIFKNQEKDWIEIEGLGIFLGNLYALNVQKVRIMYEWLDEVRKLAIENDLALKMFLKVFRIIQPKIKQKDLTNYRKYLKNVEEFMKNCPQRIQKVCDSNEISDIFKSNDTNRALSTQKSSQNQNLRSSSVASSNSEISTASKAQITKNSLRVNQNQKQEVKSQLIQQFDGHLKSLKNSGASYFDLTKFTSSSQAERKECIRRLVTFAIENPKFIENLALFTQLLMTFNFGEKKIKDFGQLLADILDEKFDIFKSEDKDWIEIENFGMFLAQSYLLSFLKKIFMIDWLNEVKKLAVENDLALKMFLKVFKIVHMKMKQKDAENYKLYLKYLEELNKNCSQRIPKLYNDWINEVLGVSKSQNAQSSTSNLSQNQNFRSSSVALSTSDISTTSKTQNESKGAIKKVLPPTQISASEICTEFQKFLKDFEATNVINYNKKLLNDASDAAIQGCAFFLVKQLLLNKEKIQNYANMIKSTVYDSINDESKQIVFRYHLSYYILADMNKFLIVEKPNTSNWDHVSKLNILIFELNKNKIIDPETIQVWLDRLQTMSSNGCVEAKNEYETYTIKSSTTRMKFKEYLNAIEEKRQANYPDQNMNTENAKVIQNCAYLYVQHSVMHSEKGGIYVNILKNIILNSFTDDSKRNLFETHVKKCFNTEIEKCQQNWNRVIKINLFIIELFNQNVIDISIVKNWHERLEKYAEDGIVEAINELKVLKAKICDKNVFQKDVPKIEVNKSNESQIANSSDEFIKLETLLKNLNQINDLSLNVHINDIAIDSTEKLERFTKFYFDFMMTSTEDHVIFVYIAKMIDKNIDIEIGFKRKFLSLISTEYFKRVKNFDAKSSEDVKIMQKLIFLIGEFYNEEWIDIEMIQMCLKELAVDNFKTLTHLELFYEFLNIISMKLVSTGDGIYVKEFLMNVYRFNTQQNAAIKLKYNKIEKQVKEIFCNSRLFKSNIDDFLTILKNLNDRNIKESAEKFKSMKIYEIDECSNDFVDICIENSENVENFVRFMAKIGKIQVDDAGNQKNFKSIVFDKIQTKLINLVEGRQASTSEYLKIYKLIGNFYKEDIMTLQKVFFCFDCLRKIPLNESFEVLEYLIPLIGAKLDSEGDILSYIINNNHYRSKSEDDKEKVKELLDMRKIYSPKEPENSNEFDQFIIYLQNVPNFSSLPSQMKAKIFANEDTMKEFAQAVYNGCINDTNMIELTMKFCKYLTENDKFKEIFSIFIQLKLISIKIEDKHKFNAIKLIANCYKIDLIEDETIKPWLSVKILDDLTYNELSVLSEIIADKNSGDFSYLDELMNEKFMKMCEEIKNDLKNVEISIEKKNDEEEVD